MVALSAAPHFSLAEQRDNLSITSLSRCRKNGFSILCTTCFVGASCQQRTTDIRVTQQSRDEKWRGARSTRLVHRCPSRYQRRHSAHVPFVRRDPEWRAAVAIHLVYRRPTFQ